MASVFSGKAGRNASVQTAKFALQQRSELEDIYGKGKTAADKAVTSGYKKSKPVLNQQYQTARGDMTGALDRGNAAILEGRGSALDAVTGGYGAAIDSVSQGYGQGINTVQQGYGQAIDAVGQRYGQATDAGNRAVEGFQPLIDKSMAGYDLYQNSQGINGAAGRDAALAAFQTGPGYQWQVDQATQGAQRAANKIGGAYGGNAQDAVTRLSSNLANQEWTNWQKGLSGYVDAAQNAVSGQAGALTNLAGIYQNQGNTESQLYANQGKDVSALQVGQGKDVGTLQVGQGKDTASIYSDAAKGLSNNQMTAGQSLSDTAMRQGENMATLETGFGQSKANNALGYMQNVAGANSNFYNTLIPSTQQGMMAGQQAAQNKMGAIMGGLQLAGQVAGAGMGSGGLFTKMWGG